MLTAEADGVLQHLDAYVVGIAAWRLGAGRSRGEDPLQAGAGVEMHAKPGERVRAGLPLLTLHPDEPERFERATEALAGSYTIGPEPPARVRLILGRVAHEYGAQQTAWPRSPQFDVFSFLDTLGRERPQWLKSLKSPVSEGPWLSCCRPADR